MFGTYLASCCQSLPIKTFLQPTKNIDVSRISDDTLGTAIYLAYFYRISAGSRQAQAAGSKPAIMINVPARHHTSQHKVSILFYSRVSEVTSGPFLGFLCCVLGTKLGGVLLFRMCFKKGVWLFVSCFGSC